MVQSRDELVGDQHDANAMHVKVNAVNCVPCLQAYECVSQAAVQQVVHVVTQMLAGCRPDVLQRMVSAGCNIAIIGRHQVRKLWVGV